MVICAANKDNLMPDFFLDIKPETIISDYNVQVNKPKTEVKVEQSPTDVERIFSAITVNLNEDIVSKVRTYPYWYEDE